METLLRRLARDPEHCTNLRPRSWRVRPAHPRDDARETGLDFVREHDELLHVRVIRVLQTALPRSEHTALHGRKIHRLSTHASILRQFDFTVKAGLTCA